MKNEFKYMPENDHCPNCGQGYLNLHETNGDLLRCSMCSKIYKRELTPEESDAYWNAVYPDDVPTFEDFLHDPEYFDNYYKNE